ncbi:MAG TPA: ABC transporter substrate-binding protein [Acidobacteriota bacterium]|nr:ABC transporter substrate-binding protein [Acidobacteriota bacterium]
MLWKRLLFIIASLSTLLALGACSDANSTPDEPGKRGFTRVGAQRFEAPLLYQKGEKTVGPESRIVEAAMEEINAPRRAQGSRPLELVWAEREYGERVPALANGEVEMAASVLAITDERRTRIDFTEPYYTSELVLVINPAMVQFTADDIQGHSIGVRQGTAIEDFAREQFPGAKIVPFPTLDPALLALRRGEIEGVIDDVNMVAYALDTVAVMKNIEILPGTLGSFEIALGVPKGSTTLLGALNKVISEAKESGELQAWLDEHIGDRTAQVRQRHEDRLTRERLAVAPRNFVLRITKANNSPFDIYKLANLTFSVRGKEGSVTTSRVRFNQRTGYASAQLKPGRYQLYLPKVFGDSSLGEILVKPDDGDRINYNLLFRADRSVYLRAAN